MKPHKRVSGFWWPLKITTFAAPKSAPACDLRDDLATQGGISRQQPKSDQAVRLTAAHGLRQIECAVVAFAGQPLEASPDQEVQASGEIIPLEERTPIDFAGRKILNLCDLFNEAIAFDDSAGMHSCLTVAIGMCRPERSTSLAEARSGKPQHAPIAQAREEVLAK